MSRFNWWRRGRKKPLLKRKDALKGRSFLLQQIEHGDFDHSDYLRQAKYELTLCKQEQKKVTSKWVASAESLQEKLIEVERKYIKRYNKLMEDYHEEETKLLALLAERLAIEFGVDCWDEALAADPNQDLIQLYHNYKKIANKKLQYAQHQTQKCSN
jgi:hypothetical protein